MRRGWLGVAGVNAPLARRIARHHGIENASGVRVRTIERDSPAASAGIESGDLIVSYDGEVIAGIDRLQQVLNAERIGKACEIVVLRHTRKVSMRAVAIERPQAIDVVLDDPAGNPRVFVHLIDGAESVISVRNHDLAVFFVSHQQDWRQRRARLDLLAVPGDAQVAHTQSG